MKKIEISETYAIPDHIHMLVKMPSKISVFHLCDAQKREAQP